MKTLILSVIADDRPGIVETLSDCVADNQGNWLESRLANLGGKFAGIVRVEVPEANESTLTDRLNDLRTHNIRVTIDGVDVEPAPTGEAVALTVTGSDRTGIVREITSLLLNEGVNVQELSSQCSNAPMSGDRIFEAQLSVILPPHLARDQLSQSLENLSDDLLVDFE